MTSVRGRMTGRLAAVAATTGLCAAGMAATAAPAAAGGAPGEGVSGQRGGASATLDGLRTHDQAVIRTGSERQEISAGLFEMTVEGGGTLQTYGVDMLNPIQEQARYEEGEWKSSSLYGNRNAGKIRWVLEHSYPRMNDLQALAEAAGAKRLTPQTAAAGTQVAIWRFSEEGPDARAGAGRAGAGAGTGADAAHKGSAREHVRITASDPAAQKLADHLVKAAKRMSEPKASLTLEPAEVSGRNGERPGPVTVRTNAPAVSLAPDPHATSQGVRVVDKKGEPVDSAVNGTELYFQLPEDIDPGTASLTAEAATKIPVGRVFTGSGGRGKSQTQVLAGSSQSTVSSAAAVNWAEGGPVPATTAEENCAKGGVDITVDNSGDAPFPLRVGGQKDEVEQGDKGTLTVPVKEDQPYRIPVTGPNGYERTFSGVLDCATSAAAGGLDQRSAPARAERPATVGGGSGGGDTVMGGSQDLAQTGGSNAPLFAAVAAAFVAIGGAVLTVVRRRS
ncbi:TQXA domain-containing protein [Streptomyces iconiensis]|uniref:TQXA domain-containing protein n=1 Tax=Streptomyces iconiensis TaxID=1384038 RepID=A0ABT7A711_9ACTN|nr:TQXA domain-containing protein [Streptomyces iconiensis]MDJ1136616.1 TQXA domain-containing protein [Streptomyces iconiensis]